MLARVVGVCATAYHFASFCEAVQVDERQLTFTDTMSPSSSLAASPKTPERADEDEVYARRPAGVAKEGSRESVWPATYYAFEYPSRQNVQESAVTPLLPSIEQEQNLSQTVRKDNISIGVATYDLAQLERALNESEQELYGEVAAHEQAREAAQKAREVEVAAAMELNSTAVQQKEACALSVIARGLLTNVYQPKFVDADARHKHLESKGDQGLKEFYALSTKQELKLYADLAKLNSTADMAWLKVQVFSAKLQKEVYELNRLNEEELKPANSTLWTMHGEDNRSENGRVSEEKRRVERQVNGVWVDELDVVKQQSRKVARMTDELSTYEDELKNASNERDRVLPEYHRRVAVTNASRLRLQKRREALDTSQKRRDVAAGELANATWNATYSDQKCSNLTKKLELVGQIHNASIAAAATAAAAEASAARRQHSAELNVVKAKEDVDKQKKYIAKQKKTLEENQLALDRVHNELAKTNTWANDKLQFGVPSRYQDRVVGSRAPGDALSSLGITLLVGLGVVLAMVVAASATTSNVLKST